VFVFPTLGDPYGLVVDEAMACSLPVISTSAAGEIEVRIDEGVNGFIVPPGDADTLANRMLSLAGDPGMATRMGEQSRMRVSERSPEFWARDFEKMVKEMLNLEADF
jgi:glycosyltransferase involved in cell wall biosynthesis